MPVSPIGRRLRWWRARRGLSRPGLADAAGVAEPWLASVEDGGGRIERRRALVALSAGLRVAVTDLTGQPYQPADAAGSAVHAGVWRLRQAVLTGAAGEAGRPAATVAAGVEAVGGLSASGDDVALAGVLPGTETAPSRSSPRNVIPDHQV